MRLTLREDAAKPGQGLDRHGRKPRDAKDCPQSQKPGGRHGTASLPGPGRKCGFRDRERMRCYYAKSSSSGESIMAVL